MSSLKKANSEKEKSKSSFWAFLSKFGSSLMLPVSILAFACFMLGIGSSIKTIPGAETTYLVLSSIANIVIANFGFIVALGIVNTFTNKNGTAVLSAAIMWLSTMVIQSFFIQPNIDANGFTSSYDVWFYSEVPSSIFINNFGMLTLNTSIFGGFVIAFFVVKIFKWTRNTILPSFLTFFSGERFPLILCFLVGPILGLLFLLVWPALGIGIENFGTWMLGLPTGVDTFLYGFINRLLIPFGLHSILLTVFNTSPVTGVLTENGQVIAQGDYFIWHKAYELGIPFSTIQTGGEFYFNNNFYTVTENVNPGQYTQGFYPIMLFAFPMAGIALTLRSKDEKRWVKIFLISLIPLLTGVTETFEFTFIFISPILYLFHAIMTGISFALMDVVNASIGMSSGWFLDPILFGIVPQAQGMITNIQWLPVIGLSIGAVYFVVFYFSEELTSLVKKRKNKKV